MKNTLALLAGGLFFLAVCCALNSCDVDKKVYNITDADTTIVIVCPHNPPCRERCR